MVAFTKHPGKFLIALILIVATAAAGRHITTARKSICKDLQLVSARFYGSENDWKVAAQIIFIMEEKKRAHYLTPGERARFSTLVEAARALWQFMEERDELAGSSHSHLDFADHAFAANGYAKIKPSCRRYLQTFDIQPPMTHYHSPVVEIPLLKSSAHTLARNLAMSLPQP